MAARWRMPGRSTHALAHPRTIAFSLMRALVRWGYCRIVHCLLSHLAPSPLLLTTPHDLPPPPFSPT
eukprot:4772678-Pleurochrysis_carterae.AAC.1